MVGIRGASGAGLALATALALSSCVSAAPTARTRTQEGRLARVTSTHPRAVTISDSYAASANTNDDKFEIVAQLGGAIRAVEARGELVFFGMGPRVHVLDVSDPREPQHVGWTDVLPGVVESVAFDGDHAYVAVGHAGLAILELATPWSPSMVGHVQTPGFAIAAVAMDDHVYVADGKEGLRVIDVSNPARPREVGSFEVSSKADDVAIVGEHVLLAEGGWDEALWVVDVSNPRAPRQEARHRLDSNVHDVFVDGSIAYVVGGYEGVLAIDLSKPNRPRLIGSYRTNGYGNSANNGIAVLAGYAYVTRGDLLGSTGGLLVLDVSDPAHMSPTGRRHAAGWIDTDMTIVGSLVVVATDDAGIQAYDISDPERPIDAWRVEEYGDAWAVGVHDNHVFVADSNWNTERGALRVVDVSDPSVPARVDRMSLDAPAGAMDIEDDHVYLGVGGSSLVIVDVSDPNSPKSVGRAAAPVADVDVRGRYAYVIGADRLTAFDVITPSTPIRLGSIGEETMSSSVAVIGTNAFISNASRLVRVVDVSNPRMLAPSWESPGIGPMRVIRPMGYNAIAVGSGALQVLDLADPSEPGVLGRTEGVVACNSVATTGPYAVAGSWDYRVYLVDVADPYSPRVVSTFEAPDRVRDVAASGEYAYLAADDAGLLVVRLPGAPSDTSENDVHEW